MSPLAVILLGIAFVLSVFLFLPFLLKPKYSVIKRLGVLQLADGLSSIRISTVVLKASGRNNSNEKGVFVLGTRGVSRGVVGDSLLDTADYSDEFPVSEQEIDEMIILLKSQEVFSVTWGEKHPVTIGIDSSAGTLTLAVKKLSWINYDFIVGLEKDDVAKLLNIFETLKSETV